MAWLGALLRSRKFWLTVGAVAVCAGTGQLDKIPYLIMASAGMIAAEDCAAKLKTGQGEETLE